MENRMKRSNMSSRRIKRTWEKLYLKRLGWYFSKTDEIHEF